MDDAFYVAQALMKNDNACTVVVRNHFLIDA